MLTNLIRLKKWRPPHNIIFVKGQPERTRCGITYVPDRHKRTTGVGTPGCMNCLTGYYRAVELWAKRWRVDWETAQRWIHEGKALAEGQDSQGFPLSEEAK